MAYYQRNHICDRKFHSRSQTIIKMLQNVKSLSQPLSSRMNVFLLIRKLQVLSSRSWIDFNILFCFKVCYNNYDRSIEDEDDFFPSSRKYTSSDAWRYQSVKELDGHDISGI